MRVADTSLEAYQRTNADLWREKVLGRMIMSDMAEFINDDTPWDGIGPSPEEREIYELKLANTLLRREVDALVARNKHIERLSMSLVRQNSRLSVELSKAIGEYHERTDEAIMENVLRFLVKDKEERE